MIKRLLITLSLVLLMAGPCSATGLRNAVDWTLGPGAEVSGQEISLIGSIIELFNDASFDTTHLSLNLDGNGTGVETDKLILTAPAISDASGLTLDAPIDSSFNFTYEVDVIFNTGDATTPYIFENLAAPPIPRVWTGTGLVGTFTRQIPASDSEAFFYKGGGSVTWDGTLGYYAAAGDTDYKVTTGTMYTFKIIFLNDSFRTELWEGATPRILTDYMPMVSATHQSFDNYLTIGKLATNAWQQELLISRYKYRIPFTSSVATMGTIGIANTIVQIPITENVEAGGQIYWGYDVGDGIVNGLSFAGLESALIGTAPDTLSLQAIMNTATGDEAVTFIINGSPVTIAESGTTAGGIVPAFITKL